jgi:hypothetical protein
MKSQLGFLVDDPPRLEPAAQEAVEQRGHAVYDEVAEGITFREWQVYRDVGRWVMLPPESRPAKPKAEACLSHQRLKMAKFLSLLIISAIRW